MDTCKYTDFCETNDTLLDKINLIPISYLLANYFTAYEK